MGVKKKNATILDKHLPSKLVINKVRMCENCPLHVFAEDGQVIMFGAGNIFASTIMVLPPYDIKAKVDYVTMIDLLEDAYKEITGLDIFEETYITRSVKCFSKTNYDLNTIAIKECANKLYYEIVRIHPNKVIVFDKNCDIDTIKANTNCNVLQVMSPAVMYYNNTELKEIFMKQLKDAINDS